MAHTPPRFQRLDAMASPGLDEITTTTLRNRSMKDKAGSKAALKTAQSGTPVPETDFSPKKKEVKAAGTGKPEKGSLAVAKSLPTETATSTPVPAKKQWEGSSEDWSADYNAAKRRGKTTADYEDSPHDRIADAAGEKRMAGDDSDKVQTAPAYKKGVSAFSNSPKVSHGYGHPASAKDGHLRNSGHSSAHRIGKK